MTWIIDPTPLVLSARVNGGPGYVILPEGQDMDDLTFESWEALRTWVQALLGQVLDVDLGEAEVQSYDEWVETQ